MIASSNPVLLYVDFPFDGPWGEQLADQLDPLAFAIAATPGLRWKLWTENKEAGRAGGVYLFANETKARNYLTEHVERLAGLGISAIRSEFFALNERLNQRTARGMAVA